jgi:hypothetical protein
MSTLQNINPGTPINLNVQVGPATGPPATEPSYAAPTGTIQLAVDGAKVGSPISLTSVNGVFPPVGFGNYGAATLTVPTDGMSAGMHTVTITYGGDSNYLASTLAITQKRPYVITSKPAIENDLRH